MTSFANVAEFSSSRSRLAAQGTDFNETRALVDAKGNVVAYAQTGGMINPTRHELGVGTIIFRFGAGGAPVRAVSRGAWWVERAEFEKLLAFANVHGLSIGLAVRILCLVPPEWSDLGLLIRARVMRPLLAYRGLGNNVIIQKSDRLGDVAFPHQNEIAARRLHQLYIAGLAAGADRALSIEQDWRFDPQAAMQGWLYL
jgi:hypothetical protein